MVRASLRAVAAGAGAGASAVASTLGSATGAEFDFASLFEQATETKSRLPRTTKRDDECDDMNGFPFRYPMRSERLSRRRARASAVLPRTKGQATPIHNV